MINGGVPQSRLPQRPVVKAGGPTDGVQPTYAPQPTYTQPVQANNQQMQPMGNILANVFNGLVNFLKSFFSAIANMFKGANNTGTTPQPTTPGPVVPTGPALDPSQAAIAQQYKLLPTSANVQAFLAEVQKYQADGALGPGSNNQGAIRDLQGALARLGYQLPQTGVYDQATAQTVMAFKQANGLRQTYASADGNFAVNEYAETQTLQLIMQKLQAMMTQQPPVAQPPVVQPPVVQPPVVQPPVVQPPVVQQPGQPNYAAIAQQYNLQNSPENVNVFLAEVQKYQTEGALGPGSNNQGAIRDLQGALARLGYQLPQTGVYDQATAQAVMAFKQTNGLRQSYRSADGNFAVNEYAETQTLQLIMQRLQAMMTQQPPAQQPAPQPAQQPAPQPAQPVQPGQPNFGAIAQQYKIQASAENVQAFLNEVKQYQVDGALGPGSNQTQAINDLQTVLQKWGFQVSPNGQFDQATQAAVIEYKKRNGLHQSYRAQDGNFAVNEYADKQTLEHIMKKLEAEMKKAS